MICDPAHGFDALSVLEVKIKKGGGPKAIQNFNLHADHTIEQIGSELFNEIMLSPEYAEMVSVNKSLFEKVDAVKINPCLGKEVDDLVEIRNLTKKKLQKKFFPEVEFMEQKIGYKNKD